MSCKGVSESFKEHDSQSEFKLFSKKFNLNQNSEWFITELKLILKSHEEERLNGKRTFQII